MGCTSNPQAARVAGRGAGAATAERTTLERLHRALLAADDLADPERGAADWLRAEVHGSAAGATHVQPRSVAGLVRALEARRDAAPIDWAAQITGEGRAELVDELAPFALFDGCLHRRSANALASRRVLGACSLRARALSLGVDGALDGRGTPSRAALYLALAQRDGRPLRDHGRPGADAAADDFVWRGLSVETLALSCMLLAAGVARRHMPAEAAGIELAYEALAPWIGMSGLARAYPADACALAFFDAPQNGERRELALAQAEAVLTHCATPELAWADLTAGAVACADALRRWSHAVALARGVEAAPRGSAEQAADHLAVPRRRAPRSAALALESLALARATPPCSPRALYAALLQPELDAQRALHRAEARALVDRVKAAARGHRWEGAVPPTRFCANELRAWVRARHAAHAAAHADRSVVLARGDLERACLALAPALAIDGAWAQGASATPRADDEPAARLFRILYDECGAAERHAHHGELFLALARELRPDLPAFPSPDFLAWDGFSEDNFAMPALWLSLAEFGQRFMGETLGLNLSIELAGVGGVYRTTARSLAAHGLDPHFFDLHEVADDVEHGHTAWSIVAIERYVAQCRSASRCDPDGAGAYAWARVRVGLAMRAESSAHHTKPRRFAIGRALRAWRSRIGS
ncbi:MAG: iron-containing redox enzyme family protein [Planctomycetota bacterium]